jgi:hypothetical protein
LVGETSFSHLLSLVKMNEQEEATGSVGRLDGWMGCNQGCQKKETKLSLHRTREKVQRNALTKRKIKCKHKYFHPRSRQRPFDKPRS